MDYAELKTASFGRRTSAMRLVARIARIPKSMTVLVYERNLLWSARLEKSLQALGHQVRVIQDGIATQGDVAIVNLGDSGVGELIRDLKTLRVKTLGHAGHKEKELHDLGREAGCDLLATNSELTYKLPALIERAQG